MECTRDTPHFCFSEIRETDNSTQDKSTEALRETTRRLFPDQDPVFYENRMIRSGCGRAFLPKRENTLPKWTILTNIS